MVKRPPTPVVLWRDALDDGGGSQGTPVATDCPIAAPTQAAPRRARAAVARSARCAQRHSVDHADRGPVARLAAPLPAVLDLSSTLSTMGAQWSIAPTGRLTTLFTRASFLLVAVAAYLQYRALDASLGRRGRSAPRRAARRRGEYSTEGARTAVSAISCHTEYATPFLPSQALLLGGHAEDVRCAGDLPFVGSPTIST